MKKIFLSFLLLGWITLSFGSELDTQFRGKTVREWLALADAPDASDLETVFKNLTPEEERTLLTPFTFLLKDPDFLRRLDAISIFSDFQTETNTVIKLLLQALEDPELLVRQSAALHLALMARRVSEEEKGLLLEALASKAKDLDDVIRGHAIDGLGNLGELARGALPVMIEGLKDPEGYVRSSAAAALSNMAADAEVVTPALVEAAKKDVDESVREAALQALGDLGPAAKGAIPALEELSKSEPIESLREMAADSLKRIQK